MMKFRFLKSSVLALVLAIVPACTRAAPTGDTANGTDGGADARATSSDFGQTDLDRIALGLEFPEARDGIKSLRYSRSGADDEPCVEPGEFEGELQLQGDSWTGLLITQEAGARVETPIDGVLDALQIAELQRLVLAVPAKEEQSGGSCDPCVNDILTVDEHFTFRACCSSCNADYAPDFDDVASFLQAVVQATQ